MAPNPTAPEPAPDGPPPLPADAGVSFDPSLDDGPVRALGGGIARSLGLVPEGAHPARDAGGVLAPLFRSRPAVEPDATDRLPASIVDPVGLALLLGLLASILRLDAAWGVNVLIFATAFSVVSDRMLAAVRPDERTDRRFGVWIAHLAATGFLFTESPTLRALDLGLVLVGLSLPLLRPAGRALADVRPIALAHAVVENAFGILCGGLLHLLERIGADGGPKRAGQRAGHRAGTVGSALGGAAIALGLALLFGGLLRSADARFDAWVGRVVDPAWILGRIAVALGIALVCLGWLSGIVRPPLGKDARIPATDPLRLRPLTVFIPLGTLALVLGSFLVLQWGRWFGGTPVPDAELAAIARRGFFQLLLVGGLALAVILAADSCLRHAAPRARRAFRPTALLLLVQVAAILGAAAWRLALYVERYGWTEDRLVASAGLLAVALALPWFAMTALRGRPERFAIGALGIGCALAFALHAIPHGELIVASHLDRTPTEEAPVDFVYLAGLPVDAIPAMAARWDHISSGDREYYRSVWKHRFERERPALAMTLPRLRAWRAVAGIIAEPPEGADPASER